MNHADHLKKKQTNNKKYKKKQRNKRKSKEERVDWIDIMGMNRDTFKRSRGAIRRK